MKKKSLETDSIALLKECDSGCKMATDCMEQVDSYVKDSDLKELVKKYDKDHVKLEEECRKLLNEAGEPGKEPDVAQKLVSWLTSEVKLQLDGDEKQIAAILTDGCNMGVKNLRALKNKYKDADPKAVELCDKLLLMEKLMADDLACFL